MNYDAWRTTELVSYWDEEPEPRCLRCAGRIRDPTGPYCGPCAVTIDGYLAAGFNPYEKGNEMKRNEALPSQYLSKDDFANPVLCEVHEVCIEEVKGDGGTKRKPILYIRNPSIPIDLERGIVLNGTNWDMLEEITGKEDSDDWIGAQIVLYLDPNVRFGNKKTGGVRIRAPKIQQRVSAPPAPPEPEPEPEPEQLHDPADDIF